MGSTFVQFWCPPMAIERLPHGLYRTVAEPMRCTVIGIHDKGCPGCTDTGGLVRDCLDYCEVCQSEIQSIDYTHKISGRNLCDGCASKGFIISPVTIPPTLSRPTGLLEWTVDACVGEGSDGGKCDCIYGVADNVLGTCPKCNGSGWLGNRVRVELPKERVGFKWGHQTAGEESIFWHELSKYMPNWERSFPIALWAEAIDAPVTLWLADGRVFKGQVTFPDCRVADPLFNPVAEAVTTSGVELVLQ